MKNKIIYLLMSVLIVSSCDLAGLDDLQPPNKLNEENVFTDENSIHNGLTGVYSLLRETAFTSIIGNNSEMSGTCVSPWGATDFSTNNVLDDNTSLGFLYSDPYKTINAVNYLLEGVDNVVDEGFSNEERDQVKAEAYFVRAFMHFILLREFGQFYDLNSQYGIVIKTKPSKEYLIEPRANVKDVYDQIFADLDFAIDKGPEFQTAVYASKLAAKALKTRVLLSMGEYGQALFLAGEVIGNDDGVELESNYDDVFANTFNSKETIFDVYWDLEQEENGHDMYWNWIWSPSETYLNLIEGDSRKNASVKAGWFSTTVNKYSEQKGAYHLFRLAEMYLISAEATLRSGGSVEDARNDLNVIRARASMPLSVATTKEELLEEIRIEKIAELAFEGVAEDWFDLIRYSILGDIEITDFRPNILSVNQFTLPIPRKTIEISKGIVIQNP